MNKPKVFIFLINKVYFNYYFHKSIVTQIQSQYDLFFGVPQEFINLVPKDMLQYTKTIPTELISNRQVKFNLIADVFRWKYRKKSKTFYFREKRLAHPFTLYSLFSIIAKKWSDKNYLKVKNSEVFTPSSQSKIGIYTLFSNFFSKYGYWFYKSTLYRYLVRVISHRPIFNFFDFFIVKKFKYSQDLYSFILNQQINLLIFVSSAHEPLGIFLTQVQKELSKPTLFIIDNWDNLSSKTILWDLPSHIATWGEQSSRHAIEIQGFKHDQVFNLGTARFLDYPKLRSKKISSLVDYRYILFLGTALPFDEIKCLEVLSHELVSNQSFYGDLYILYRPHPYGFKNHAGNYLNLPPKVVIEDTVFKDFKVNNELLDIEKIPALLKNSELIVGGLTSMLIEGSIFAKNIIGLVHKEKYSITSPHKILVSYEHFKEINILPNLTLCHSLDDLSSILRETFKKSELSVNSIDNKLNFFYDIKGENYNIKLYKIIKKILDHQH